MNGTLFNQSLLEPLSQSLQSLPKISTEKKPLICIVSLLVEKGSKQKGKQMLDNFSSLNS